MPFFSRLSTRYGNEIAEPTDFDLRYTLTDLFHGIAPADHESPSAWYAVGQTDNDVSSFHGILVERAGRVTFEYQSDAPGASHFQYEALVSEQEAHMLWQQLSRRKTEWILEWFLSR